MTDAEIEEAARRYANRNSDELIASVVGDEICQSVPEGGTPFTIFMAGSPGAGKTEWSKNLIELFSNSRYGVARIDADDFRPLLPDYDGSNSHLFQRAASGLLANAFHSALNHRKNCIVDTTFSKIGTAVSNVGDALNRGRLVEIAYVYQEPTSAWRFVQEREAKEGRRILPQTFAEAFINAPKVVDSIMATHAERVTLTVVIKDILADKEPAIYTRVKSIASVLKNKYNNVEEVLNLILPPQV